MKISLIGAGNIGGSLASVLGSSQMVQELALIDVAQGVPEGKALDIGHALTICGSDVSIVGSSDYAAMRGSDAIVVTAGIPRKPGMSRDDLLSVNASIVKSVAEGISKYSPDALVIVVTNPLDVMVWCMHKYSGLPSNRVVGMAGVLDSARFSFFLAQHMKVSVKSVSSIVLGGHGDLMLPLLRHSTVGGVSVESLIEQGALSRDDVSAIVERTRKGGEEIVKLLGSGSAYYAPAASCALMLESYISDKRMVLPCSAYLEGQYGVRDLFVGVPVVIGRNGVEKILEFSMTEEEQGVLNQSVGLIRDLLDATSRLL
ncbi:MAG: malate dehydrogenase [Anaplasma sp.]